MRKIQTALLSSILFFSVPVFAQEDIFVNFRTSEEGDDGGAALLITPYREIEQLVISLQRTASDGAKENFTFRPSLKKGEENVVPLPHPIGDFIWEGTMHVKFADKDEGEMPLVFESSRRGQPLIIADDVSSKDVLNRRVVVKSDRAIARAEVEVFGDGGKALGRTVVDLGGAGAGSDLVISWEQEEEGDPLMVFLKLFDLEDRWKGIRWTPWRVSLPHETVDFDTGKAEIRPDQMPKLKAVMSEMNRQINRYKGLVDVEGILWIVGHTDTVGTPEYNMRLSQARARSIATWFRGAGVKGQIFYRGMGQEVLLVKTPDNIDEPKNRRAEYVISAEDPLVERQLPGKWVQLP